MASELRTLFNSLLRSIRMILNLHRSTSVLFIGRCAAARNQTPESPMYPELLS